MNYSNMVLGTLVLLGACAKQAELAPAAASVNANNAATIPSTDTDPTRLCPDDQRITGLSVPALEDFFGGTVVRNLEGHVTFCIQFATLTSNKIAPDFRVEYEDDRGISAVEFNRDDHILFAEMKRVSTTDDRRTIEIIFVDDYGMVSVKGQQAVLNGPMITTLKFHNFPSYEEAILEASEEEAEKCRSGEYTIAQCLGVAPMPYTQWWNQPLPQSQTEQVLTKAREILANTTKTRTVGSMSFDLADVME